MKFFEDTFEILNKPFNLFLLLLSEGFKEYNNNKYSVNSDKFEPNEIQTRFLKIVEDLKNIVLNQNNYTLKQLKTILNKKVDEYFKLIDLRIILKNILLKLYKIRDLNFKNDEDEFNKNPLKFYNNIYNDINNDEVLKLSNKIIKPIKNIIKDIIIKDEDNKKDKELKEEDAEKIKNIELDKDIFTDKDLTDLEEKYNNPELIKIYTPEDFYKFKQLKKLIKDYKDIRDGYYQQTTYINKKFYKDKLDKIKNRIFKYINDDLKYIDNVNLTFLHILKNIKRIKQLKQFLSFKQNSPNFDEWLKEYNEYFILYNKLPQQYKEKLLISYNIDFINFNKIQNNGESSIINDANLIYKLLIYLQFKFIQEQDNLDVETYDKLKTQLNNAIQYVTNKKYNFGSLEKLDSWEKTLNILCKGYDINNIYIRRLLYKLDSYLKNIDLSYWNETPFIITSFTQFDDIYEKYKKGDKDDESVYKKLVKYINSDNSTFKQNEDDELQQKDEEEIKEKIKEEIKEDEDKKEDIIEDKKEDEEEEIVVENKKENDDEDEEDDLKIVYDADGKFKSKSKSKSNIDKKNININRIILKKQREKELKTIRILKRQNKINQIISNFMKQQNEGEFSQGENVGPNPRNKEENKEGGALFDKNLLNKYINRIS